MATKMNFRLVARLFIINIIFLILLVLLTYAIPQAEEFLRESKMYYREPVILSFFLSDLLESGLSLFTIPAFAIIFTFVVCKAVNYEKRLRLAAINSVLFFVTALLICYGIYNSFYRLILFFPQVFFTFPSNLLCVMITQVTIALLFFRKHAFLKKGKTKKGFGDVFAPPFSAAPGDALPVAVVDSATFPDTTWREYANSKFAKKDYILTKEEAEKVTTIYASERGITDLTGVGYFINVTELDCSCNSLTSLDVTRLTNLKELVCWENSLTSLDVTGLVNLNDFQCNENSLLEVVGLAQPLDNWSGDAQTRTIPMETDGRGGYVSTDSYPLQVTNTLSGLDAGVTYDALTGKFHADTVPRMSSFSTSLSRTGHSVSGVLTFTLP